MIPVDTWGLMMRATRRYLEDDTAEWLRRYRARWQIAQPFDLFASFTATCRECGVIVKLPTSAMLTGDMSALRCACDDERAWREHFGILAEIA